MKEVKQTIAVALPEDIYYALKRLLTYELAKMRYYNIKDNYDLLLAAETRLMQAAHVLEETRRYEGLMKQFNGKGRQ